MAQDLAALLFLAKENQTSVADMMTQYFSP